MKRQHVTVVIPALNEEDSLPLVLAAIPSEIVDEVIVVDNGSTDKTAEVARLGGARVVREDERGYGAACLAGLAAIERTDVVVFLDGDFADDPGELGRVVAPILDGEADMVIGSRVLGAREPGALLPHARFGNWLAVSLIRLFWGQRFTDLGPFRAVRSSSLEGLNMRDRSFGWTVEMQIEAARQGLRCREVPVSYRRRVGVSKISGTVRGTVMAGSIILWTVFKKLCQGRPNRPHHAEEVGA
ncbi:MAG TPA: glycosyltransferase family 2 protein [Planctomycetes bacterium]|nr:glycosyltransferase family 2 protein [Planctomycetota bacterium]